MREAIAEASCVMVYDVVKSEECRLATMRSIDARKSLEHRRLNDGWFAACAKMSLSVEEG